MYVQHFIHIEFPLKLHSVLHSTLCLLLSKLDHPKGLVSRTQHTMTKTKIIHLSSKANSFRWRGSHFFFGEKDSLRNSIEETISRGCFQGLYHLLLLFFLLSIYFFLITDHQS